MTEKNDYIEHLPHEATPECGMLVKFGDRKSTFLPTYDTLQEVTRMLITVQSDSHSTANGAARSRRR